MRALLEVLGRMECQLTFVRTGPSTVGTLGNQLPSRAPSCPVPLARQAGVPRNEAAGRLCLLRLRSLRRHNGIFRGFGNPELHYLLSGDFDRCARSRVPTHPRLAVHTDQSPESGQDEQAILLDLGDGYVGECVQQALRYFLGDLARVCEGLDDLRLCHHDSLIPVYADELMVRQNRTISKSLETALVESQAAATISSSVSGDSPVDVFACVVSSSPMYNGHEVHRQASWTDSHAYTKAHS